MKKKMKYTMILVSCFIKVVLLIHLV